MRAIVIAIAAVYSVLAGPAVAEGTTKTATSSQILKMQHDANKNAIQNIKARQAPQKDLHQQTVTHSGGSRSK
jgi:Tfp pilus assembly major pilin PilA